MIGHRILALLVTAVLAPTACTTRVQPSPPATPVAAQLSVESFLQAANRRDLASMGRLFGTTEGPLIETGSTFSCAFKKVGSWFGGTACRKREDVELRMGAIASALRHDDYRIDRQEGVAGRLDAATRVVVDLTVQGDAVEDVSFVVVRDSGGQWLVEQVDLEAAMARR